MHNFHRKCNIIRVGGAPERNIIGSGVQGEPPPGFYIFKGGVMDQSYLFLLMVSPKIIIIKIFGTRDPEKEEIDWWIHRLALLI